MKFLLRNKIIILFILLLMYFLPFAIGLPQQSRSENIITAMGVDKTDEGYEVHIQYVLPYDTSNSSSLKVMTGKGDTVSQAVEKLDMEYGRISGFAHCRALIFNNKACEEDISKVLDYLVRIKTNTNDVILINASTTSKEVLECATNLDNELYTIINSNGIANEQRKFQDLKSANDFYNALFGECKCIAVSVIGTEEAEQDKPSSGGGQGGLQSGNSGSQKKIKNHGELAILINGVKTLELNEDESENLNWFDEQVVESRLSLKNFTDDLYKDANLDFFVLRKTKSMSVDFVNGEPCMNIRITARIRLSQVDEKNVGQEVYEVSRKEFSDKLKNVLKDTIKEKMLAAENNFKQNRYDVINCAETFHKFKNKEYKQYLSTLEDPLEFIEHVKFTYDINVEQRR